MDQDCTLFADALTRQNISSLVAHRNRNWNHICRSTHNTGRCTRRIHQKSDWNHILQLSSPTYQGESSPEVHTHTRKDPRSNETFGTAARFCPPDAPSSAWCCLRHKQRPWQPLPEGGRVQPCCYYYSYDSIAQKGVIGNSWVSGTVMESSTTYTYLECMHQRIGSILSNDLQTIWQFSRRYYDNFSLNSRGSLLQKYQLVSPDVDPNEIVGIENVVSEQHSGVCDGHVLDETREQTALKHMLHTYIKSLQITYHPPYTGIAGVL